MDSTEIWRWGQAMRAMRARERLEFQQDINAALNPIHWQPLRMHLGEEAYDEDSPEYEQHVVGMAQERPVTTSE